MTRVKLRIAQRQYRELARHLFPGDGKEAVALALCGRGSGIDTDLVCVHEVHAVPYEACRRSSDRLDWSPTAIEPLLGRAAKDGLAILKIHSHPNGYTAFSAADDDSDRKTFESIFGWIDSDRPHVSAVMLPDGRIFGRAIYPGDESTPLSSILIVGDDVTIYDEPGDGVTAVEDFTERHAQLFGSGTTNLLRRLRVAVVGCSGTGSIVIEQLARLGVGELVLVDPERVERKNLNRIVGASRDDVGRLKVDVLKDHVDRMKLGTVVHVFATSVEKRETIGAVASSDVVHGCMDSLFGRNVLSRIAQYYLLPYVDVGVKLEALSDGRINQVAGAVHFLSPDGPDLIERGVFSPQDLEAEDLHRTNPEEYKERRARGYVRGVRVDRPAVVSVNTVFAGLAVTEMLARLHPFRTDDNAELGGIILSLSNLIIGRVSVTRAQQRPRRWIGRGDADPALGMPALAGGS